MKNDSTLKEAGLKVTHPRIKILELLQSHPESHLSAEEIHNKLVKKEETIGLATIYRVLTQLEITKTYFPQPTWTLVDVSARID